MRVIDKLLGIIAPHHCLQCGREGRLLCEWCCETALTEVMERCYRCGKASIDSATCAACRPHAALEHVWARTKYDGPVKELVYQLKFGFARQAATEMAHAMNNSLPYVPPETVLCHVPAVPSHVRQRGLDQAALIARDLGKVTKTAHMTLLARVGTSRQVGSTRSQRLTQQAEAFRAISLPLIRGAHIVLVDDVMTTGGTLDAAAKTLRAAGAARVDAAIFAYAE